MLDYSEEGTLWDYQRERPGVVFLAVFPAVRPSVFGEGRDGLRLIVSLFGGARCCKSPALSGFQHPQLRGVEGARKIGEIPMAGQTVIGAIRGVDD